MNNLKNINGTYRALRILHIALLAGMVMFAGVIYFISRDIIPAPMEQLQKDALIAALAVAIICLSVSSFLWRKDIVRIQQESLTLTEKFEIYRKSAVRRYALSEAPGMFSIVCYFMTQDSRILIVTLLMILHLASLMPTSAKIALQLGESAEDIEKL